MSEELTREQFKEMVSPLTNFRRSAALVHDAAQRATIQQLEAEIEGFRTALGCHRAYILESIRDLQAKTEDIPNIDRVRQAEMQAQQLEAHVKNVERVNFDYHLGQHAMEEHIRKLEAKLAELQGEA